MASIGSKELAHSVQEYVVAQRRTFHRHPEVSFQEKETCRRICDQLGEMGIEHQVVGGYNVVGVIRGGQAGKRVAIRADIDALPIQEETDLPFQSGNPGVMHACGHDGHTAILLGTAKALLQIKEELCGTVYLCFQTAEERGGGADEMVAWLKEQGGVDLAFGTHLFAYIPVGVIGIPAGPMLAGAGSWKVTVHGRGGHASRPDRAVNPVPAACDILLKLAAIPVNRHAPYDVCVIAPTMIHGGEVRNVIPDDARIEGGFRFFKYGDNGKIADTIRQIAENTARAYGAEAQVEVPDRYTPPVVNDAGSVAFARQTLQELGLLKIMEMPEPDTGSDNFGAFLQAFPGFYCAIGAQCSREGASCNHHNSKFDIDEAAFLPAVAFFVEHTRRFLIK